MNEPAFVKVQLGIFSWMHRLLILYHKMGTSPFMK